VEKTPTARCSVSTIIISLRMINERNQLRFKKNFSNQFRQSQSKSRKLSCHLPD
jgi:hypothetical protein